MISQSFCLTPKVSPKLEEWNETMVIRGSDTEEKWDYFKKGRDAIDPIRTDITTWADLLGLAEQRPVPLRTDVSGRGAHAGCGV
ncbi:MAG: DUF5069 domain-containing protein [Nitrospiraceae bacterium]